MRNKYDFLELALKQKKINAKSTGKALFVSPSGFFKRIRLFVALWILPRETLVVLEPYQEAQRDLALLHRLGVEVFDGYGKHDSETSSKARANPNLWESREQQQKPSNYRSHRGHDAE